MAIRYHAFASARCLRSSIQLRDRQHSRGVGWSLKEPPVGHQRAIAFSSLAGPPFPHPVTSRVKEGDQRITARRRDPAMT